MDGRGVKGSGGSGFLKDIRPDRAGWSAASTARLADVAATGGEVAAFQQGVHQDELELARHGHWLKAVGDEAAGADSGFAHDGCIIP